MTQNRYDCYSLSHERVGYMEQPKTIYSTRSLHALLTERVKSLDGAYITNAPWL